MRTTFLNRFAGGVLLLLFALPLTGCTEQAEAQPTKIGYTDPELILVNMTEYADVQRQLQAEKTRGDQAMQSMYQEFQEKLERYQTQQSLLTEENRQKREEELVGLQNNLQQAPLQQEQKLARMQAELMNPLITRLNTAIDEVAKEQALDIVLSSQAVLFVNENTMTDITEAVAKRLGIEVPEEAAADTAATN